MERHQDFENIRNDFISKWGGTQGQIIYDAYVYNEEFDETKPLPTETDAISNNLGSTQKTLNDFLLSERVKYDLIIDRFMEQAYDQGLQTSAIELSMLPSEFGDLRGQKEQLKVLQANSKNLLFNLMDDIQKEMGLVLTDANLNNIPFTNAQIKKEVQGIFNNKVGRLQSQIVSETDRAFNTALEFGYKRSGLVTHKQWVAVIDNRTSSICQGLNGEIVQIGEPFSLGFYTPPAHPNCRSRVVGITLSEFDMLKNNDSVKTWYDLPRIQELMA